MMAHDGPPVAAKRPRGRPPQMTQAALLERIRALAEREGGLFRVHRTHGGVYARARRQFGSWAAAVAAAGQDYQRALDTARQRSIENRRRSRRRARNARRLTLLGEPPVNQSETGS